MDDYCKGKNKKGLQCGLRQLENGYCKHHQNQRVKLPQCLCMLTSGKQCEKESIDDEFCYEHQQHNLCCGKMLLNRICKIPIEKGLFCNRHMKQSPPISDAIITNAHKLRSILKTGEHCMAKTRIRRTTLNKVSVVIPKSLKTEVLDKPDSCPICMESIDDVKLPIGKCGHWMHIDCVSEMLNTQCPICRADMSNLTSKVRDKIKANGDKYNQEKIANAELEIQRMMDMSALDIFINMYIGQ